MLTFVKPECDNVLQTKMLQPSWAANTLSHSGLANGNIQKRLFYLLNKKSTIKTNSMYIKQQVEINQVVSQIICITIFMYNLGMCF